MNGLVGAKNRGRARQPKENRIKQMDWLGLSTGRRAGQPKEKRKLNGLVGAKNRGLGRPAQGKERKRMSSRG